jgi:predicted RNA-binding protein with RPS1 domain
MSWGRVNHPSRSSRSATRSPSRSSSTTPRPSASPSASSRPGRSVEPRRGSTRVGQEGPRQGRVDHRLRRLRRARAGRRGPHPRQRDELDQEGQAPVEAPRVGQEIECQVLEVDARAKRISLGLKQLEPDPWTLFTDKYHPGDKIARQGPLDHRLRRLHRHRRGRRRHGPQERPLVDVRVNNPSDLYHKGDDVEAIILSINHDEKKVSASASSSSSTTRGPSDLTKNEFPRDRRARVPTSTQDRAWSSASSTTASSCFVASRA